MQISGFFFEVSNIVVLLCRIFKTFMAKFNEYIKETCKFSEINSIETMIKTEGKLCKLAQKDDFYKMESEMKSLLIGKQIERMELI
jgi:hypothetical protein